MDNKNNMLVSGAIPDLPLLLLIQVALTQKQLLHRPTCRVLFKPDACVLCRNPAERYDSRVRIVALSVGLVTELADEFFPDLRCNIDLISCDQTGRTKLLRHPRDATHQMRHLGPRV